MNITYTIARYEQMNKEDFLVAFNVQIEDYEIFYIESVLPLSSINEKTSQQVCQLAYENIKINVLNIWKEDVSVTLGKASKESGDYAAKSLAIAVDYLKNKKIDVLVTAPINKETIQSEDFNFPGHTEYLEDKLEGESLMILMTDPILLKLNGD